MYIRNLLQILYLQMMTQRIDSRKPRNLKFIFNYLKAKREFIFTL